MSTTVDNRVVQMEFDNRKFESNVETSMSTLDKLKKALNLDNAAKGLSGISAAAKKVDMNPIGRAAETVGLKFNALYTVADQALRNITNSAMMHGKRIISALTLEPVKTGFSEYETKLGSIQTIMSNTASKGTTMADVTQVIDELNTYADKTIYNFAEMTKNIGTFTAAGVGLEESAAAIQGIANLAAASGSTSQQASTAMYQLSQALAAGSVKLMDWNSVVNAGMGGEKFQEALKATARDHGVAVDEIIEKNGSFRESLSEGWITADILNETLNKFTVEGAKNYAKSMMESGQWTQKQADALVKEAQAMEDAATKVKTFTQLWDTLKESAQSGWGKTWELIVGDFESAKEMWTGVSNVLGGIIEKSANARNDALEGALTSNWGKLTKEVNAAGIETKEFEEIVKNVARNEGYNVDKLIEEYGSLENVFHKGAIQSWVLKRALNGVGDSTADLSKVARDLTFNMKGEDVKQVEEALLSLGYTLTGKDGKFYGDDGYYGTLTRDAVKAFQEVEGLKVTGIVDDETLNALKEATKGASIFDGELDELANSVTELSGRQKLLIGFKYFFTGFKKILEPVGKAFREVFPRTTSDQISGLIDKFYDLSASFVNFTGSVKGQKVIAGITAIFKTLFTVIDLGLTVIKEISSTVFGILFKGFLKGIQGTSMFSGSLAESIAAVKDWIVATGFIPAVIGKVSQWFQNGVEFVKNFATSVTESVSSFVGSFGGVGEMLTALFGAPFALAISKLGEFIDRVKNYKKFNKNTLSFMFLDFKTNVLEYFKKVDPNTFFGGFLNIIKSFVSYVKTGFGTVGGKFDGIIGKFVEFGTALKEKVSDNIGKFVGLGSLIAFIYMFKKIGDAISIISSPIEMLDDLGETLQGLGKSIKFGVKAEAVKSIAIAIGILAASLAVLAFIPWQKLLKATLAIIAVSVSLAIVIKSLGAVSDNVGDTIKVSGAIMMLAGSILIFAIAAKKLSSIDDGGVGKCLVLLGGFAGIMALMMAVSKTANPVDVSTFGTMMLGIGGALALFAIAVGIFGRMKAGTLIKGGLAVMVFLVMMKGVMKVAGGLKSQLPKFGAIMLSMSASLLIFALAAGIIARMKTKTLVKGTIAIAVFLSLMKGVMKATSLMGNDIPKFGSTMLGLSTGLLALGLAAKVLGSINTGALVKGVLAIAAFMGMMVGVMAATRLLTEQSANLGKVGLMMLAFGGAILMMTASVALLSLIKPGDLAKAVAAVAVMGAIFAGLIAVTKFANAAKGMKGILITMTIAIGLMAASIAALSFIDSSKLAGATKALTMIMVAFGLLIASTKLMGSVGFKSMATLVVLSGVVLILGGVIKELASLNVDAAISIATSLSVLIVALSGACLLLGAIGTIGGAAFIGVGVLAAVLGVIYEFAKVATASLPTMGTQLSEFMTNLKPFLDGAKSIDTGLGKSLAALGAGLAVLGVVGLGSAYTFGIPFKRFAKDMVHVGQGIQAFNEAVSGNNFDATRIKAAAEAVAVLSAASAVTSVSSNIFDWISSFAGKESSFEGFGKDLIPVADGLKHFNDQVSGEDFSVDKIKAAAEAANVLAGVQATVNDSTGLLDWIANFTGKESTLEGFGKDLIPLADGLVDFNTKVTTDSFDVSRIKAAAEAAKTLSEVSADASDSYGLLSWIGEFTGKGSSFENFGADLEPVANGLNDFNTIVTGSNFDIEKIKGAATAAEQLSKISASVNENDNLLDYIARMKGKDDSFAAFGSSLEPVANGLDKFNATVTGSNFDVEKIKAAAEAASALAAVKTDITEGSGLLDFICGLSGQTNAFENFGWELIPLATGLVNFNSTITDGNLDVEKMKAAATAASDLAGISTTLNEGTGFMDWLGTWATGETALESFAGNLEGLGNGLVKFNTAISGTTFNPEQVTAATDVLSTIQGIAASVAESTKGWEFFTGADSLADFAANVETLGGGIAKFGSSVSAETFNVATVKAAIAEIEKLVGFGSTIGGEGFGSLTGFASEIANLGHQMMLFYNNVKDIDTTKISDIGTGVAALASVQVSDATTLQSFMDALATVNTDGVATIVAEFEKLSGLEANTGVLSALASTIGNLGGQMYIFGGGLAAVDTAKINNIVTSLNNMSTVKAIDTSVFQTFADSLGSISSESMTAFADAISTASSDILANATTLGENVAKGITTGMGSPSEHMKSAFSSANTKIRSYWNTFWSAGSYLMQGLAQGIKYGKSGVVNQIIKVCKAAIEEANAAFEINSPSKVFARIGSGVGEGFVNGLASYENRVVNASTSIADYAKRGMANAVGNVYDMISNGIDAEPTIRPVLDLSAISAGANQINGMLSMNPSIGAMANVTAINSMMSGRQNGSNGDVVSAIKELGASLSGNAGVTNNYINGVSNGDGNVADAIGIIVSAAMRERRA